MPIEYIYIYITLDIQLEVSHRLGQQELDYRPK